MRLALFAAIMLTACSRPAPEVHNAPMPSSAVMDSREPQNLQEKPLDFSAPAGHGAAKSLDAQGDINNLLDQIHREKTEPGR